MTIDDVIRWAIEAGLDVHPRKNVIRIGTDILTGEDSTGKVVNLAASAYAAGAAAEREECARVCESQWKDSPWLIEAAAAIRARGKE